MKYVIRVDYDGVSIGYISEVVKLDDFWMSGKNDAIRYESALDAIKVYHRLSKKFTQYKLTIEIDILHDIEYYSEEYADSILPDAKSANSGDMQATFWLYAKNGYKQGYIDALKEEEQ